MASFDCITFLTDYGLEDGFVAACHGVAARISPGTRLIDITHLVPPGDVRRGAAVLAQTIPYLPPGVHVAVVDPGVGTARRGIAVAAGDSVLVGPDNGLLTIAAETLGGVVEAVDVGRSPESLRPVSATFHGRDVFAPVAAALADGVALAALGEPIAPRSLAELTLPRARRAGDTVVAHVLTTDVYGNVALDAPFELAADAGLEAGASLVVEVGGRPASAQLGRTFADVASGALLAYRDARGALALAVNGGSAAAELGLRPDVEIVLRAR